MRRANSYKAQKKGCYKLIGCKLNFSTAGGFYKAVDSESFYFYFLGFWASDWGRLEVQLGPGFRPVDRSPTTGT